jgi:SAM-dependent methyltransferase
MKLRHALLVSPAFTFKNNVFYQRNIHVPIEFEQTYLALRHEEKRLYPDDTILALPDISSSHTLRKEWMSRRFTLKHLMRYLQKRCQNTEPVILEIGCGNGWLCNHLAMLKGSEVLGADINEYELLQARRIFRRENLQFAYTDILSDALPIHQFDYIILSASIQYFRELNILFDKLFTLLAPRGQIHILDSPLYAADHITSAKTRSENYFALHGAHKMNQYYHHHRLDNLMLYHPQILYNPHTFINRIKRMFSVQSPFYWLALSNEAT